MDEEITDETVDATPAADTADTAINDEEETTDTASTNLMASDKSDDTEE